MHTTEGPQGTRFHHNGDFSGLVKFAVPLAGEKKSVDVEAAFSDLVLAACTTPGSWARPLARREDNDEVCAVEVPTADLQALVAARVRAERISHLEEMSSEELFADALGTKITIWAPLGNSTTSTGSSDPGVSKVRDPETQWYETGTWVRMIDTPSVYGEVWESIWNLGVCDVHFRQPNGQKTTAPQHYLEECTPDGQAL